MNSNINKNVKRSPAPLICKEPICKRKSEALHCEEPVSSATSALPTYIVATPADTGNKHHLHRRIGRLQWQQSHLAVPTKPAYTAANGNYTAAQHNYSLASPADSRNKAHLHSRNAHLQWQQSPLTVPHTTLTLPQSPTTQNKMPPTLNNFATTT